MDHRANPERLESAPNPFDEPEESAIAQPDRADPDETTTDPVAAQARELLAERRAGEPWDVDRRETLEGLESQLEASSPASVDSPLAALEGKPAGDVLKGLRADLEAHDSQAKVRRLQGVLKASTDWTGKVPPRDWLSPYWLPTGRVTMLSGRGGSGKSVLALQLAAAVASGSGRSDSGSGGVPIMAGTSSRKGTAPKVLCDASPVVFATWEDEHSETLRRLALLPDTFEQRPLRGELAGRLHVLDLAGSGALWGPEGRLHRDTVATVTQLGRDLEDYVGTIRPRLLVIDPVAGAYGANENDRAAVRAWLAHLNALAKEVGCAVLLVAHPPKGAQADVYSGSTDWRNGVRAMWTLAPMNVPNYTRGPKLTGKRSAKPAQGIALHLEKSNYAKAGRTAWLRFRVENGEQGPKRQARAIRLMAWEECGAREAAEGYHDFREWSKPIAHSNNSNREAEKSPPTQQNPAL